ncbi:hypothetical protein HYW46_07050 [Candidatus Daviesbacteria bacterium]|nr:hypothetical protein [Candidatus Daviesbacteria bacterium]
MNPTKILLPGLLILTASLVLINPMLVSAATLSLSPSTAAINRGCNFSLNVALDTTGTQTDGTDAILSYDPTAVTPVTIINGSIYPDYPGNFIDVQGKKINISGLASVTQAYSGQGVLATINFTVPQNAPLRSTQINFEFDPNDKTKTTDSNVVERGTVADVLNSVVNGTYTVGSGACIPVGQPVPTPSPTYRPGQTPSPTFYPGQTSTPSATPLVTLCPGGTCPGIVGPTLALTIIGGILTVLGILGLALL